MPRDLAVSGIGAVGPVYSYSNAYSSYIRGLTDYSKLKYGGLKQNTRLCCASQFKKLSKFN